MMALTENLVSGASMERREDPAYDFNEPLLERLVSGEESGVDTGGGKALLFDVKGMSEAVKRCDVIMHHQAAISIMESGVQVSF